MNKFFHKMPRCISADVMNKDHPCATFRMLANKGPKWCGKCSTQRLMPTLMGVSTKAGL